jgi:hypothetical protein
LPVSAQIEGGRSEHTVLNLEERKELDSAGPGQLRIDIRRQAEIDRYQRLVSLEVARADERARRRRGEDGDVGVT